MKVGAHVLLGCLLLVSVYEYLFIQCIHGLKREILSKYL
jgi:hypothetical protein